MVEKDNYATTSPLNEGAGATNTYMADSPLGNVRIYDLDAQIPPIERMQIVPNVPNLAPSIPSTTPAISEVSETTTTIATISPKKDYLLLKIAGVAVAGILAYQILKKR